MKMFGEQLRKHRTGKRLSLRSLGERTGYDYTYLSAIECGRKPGSLDLAEKCDEALAAGGVLVKSFQAFAIQGGDDIVNRRTVIQTLTNLAVSTTAPMIAIEAARQGLNAACSSSVSGVDEWNLLAADYTRDFYTTASSELLEQLTADVLILQNVIGSEANRSTIRGYQRAAAQLAVVMAMTLASIGKPSQARRWWTTARNASDLSADPDIRVWVRNWEAVNGLYERRPIPAILRETDQAISISGMRPIVGVAGHCQPALKGFPC